MKMQWELNLYNYFWLLTVYSFRSTGGGSVVFDSLFSLLYCLWGFVFGPCLIMQYLASFLDFHANQTSMCLDPHLN